MAKGKDIQKQGEGDSIEAIVRELRKTLEHLKNAAQMYVRLLDRNPATRQRLIDAMNKEGLPFTVRDANWLERIGRGEAHYMCYLNQGNRNVSHIRKLPYSEQRAIFEEHKRYPLLLPDGDQMQVDVLNISKDQANQIFDDNCIRDLGEQKAWLVEHVANDSIEEIKEPYIIGKGYVDILPHEGKLRITRAKIQEWLLGM